MPYRLLADGQGATERQLGSRQVVTEEFINGCNLECIVKAPIGSPGRHTLGEKATELARVSQCWNPDFLLDPPVVPGLLVALRLAIGFMDCHDHAGIQRRNPAHDPSKEDVDGCLVGIRKPSVGIVDNDDWGDLAKPDELKHADDDLPDFFGGDRLIDPCPLVS